MKTHFIRQQFPVELDLQYGYVGGRFEKRKPKRADEE
jgi:hypothetical protein